MNGTCTLLGCDRLHRANGYCNMHWKRWKKTGDPGPVDSLKRTRCTLDGCDGKHYGRGYCEKHYQRFMKYGSPHVVMPNGNWCGDAARYQGVHARLYRQRGRADAHMCTWCDQQAYDWAYDRDPDDPHVRYESGMPYSVNLARYIPLCRSCHRRHDLTVVT